MASLSRSLMSRGGRNAVISKPTKSERREQRRKTARKMGVSGSGVKRVYPDAVQKRAKETKE